MLSAKGVYRNGRKTGLHTHIHTPILPFMDNFDNYTPADWERYFRQRATVYTRLADAVATVSDGNDGSHNRNRVLHYTPPSEKITTSTQPANNEPNSFFASSPASKLVTASEICAAVAGKASRLGALADRLHVKKDVIRKLSKTPDSGFIIKSRGWVTLSKPQHELL